MSMVGIRIAYGTIHSIQNTVLAPYMHILYFASIFFFVSETLHNSFEYKIRFTSPFRIFDYGFIVANFGKLDIYALHVIWTGFKYYRWFVTWFWWHKRTTNNNFILFEIPMQQQRNNSNDNRLWRPKRIDKYNTNNKREREKSSFSLKAIPRDERKWLLYGNRIKAFCIMYFWAHSVGLVSNAKVIKIVI